MTDSCDDSEIPSGYSYDSTTGLYSYSATTSVYDDLTGSTTVTVTTYYYNCATQTYT
jgi:hypothetical protein